MDQLVFEVGFVPKEVNRTSAPICVVIDVLRASTSMVTLLESGCSEIILTSDEKHTLDQYLSSGANDVIVCAEDADGNVAEYADFSPSILSIRQNQVFGKRVIFRTTNGTRAAQTLWNMGIEEIYIGCMHNAEAVMKEAVARASQLKKNITIVCAGRENGEITALDDVYTAGILLKYGKEASLSAGLKPVLRDSAKIAEHMNEVYSDTIMAFENSGSGETMKRINSTEDIAICAQENISKLAPVLTLNQSNGNIVVKNSIEVTN